MLIYQLYLAKKFLNEIGIPNDVLRFRQHLPGEMAHYALDCWDVEVLTDKYGWVEIIGIADRGDYDLSSHSKYSNDELNVFIEYDEPKKVKKTVVKPNLSKFGPIFKGDSPKIKQAIEEADPNEVMKAIEEKGKFVVELDKTYEVPEELLIFEDVEEEINGEKIIPHVIEPSFGIDRIVYSVLLHSFHTAENEDDKDYFKFAKSIAPVQLGIFPLVNKEGPREIAIELTEKLRSHGFTVEYDASGTIGKRYARADEIGIPLAITVDFESLEDNQVTVRDRDTEQQERIAIDSLEDYLKNYYK